MASERNIDRIIREAMEKGEFDNLPGRGKPQRLEEDHGIPADLRAAYRILKNSGYVPEEVHVMKDLERLRDELASCTDEKRKAELTKTIREKQLQVDMMLERLRRG